MNTLMSKVRPVSGIIWQLNIYASRFIPGPSDQLDCMNKCLNVESGSFCQLFVFQNGICHLGRSDVTNGAVSLNSSTEFVYVLKGFL